MLTFEQTVKELYDRTEEFSVYALPGYNNGPCIGIRDTYYGMKEEFIIDNACFFVAGQVIDKETGQVENMMRNLEAMEICDIKLPLHAVCYSITPIYLEIKLGDYNVIEKTVIKRGFFGPEVIELKVRRV